MELNRFKQLLESTMGNVKPLIYEDDTTKQGVDITGDMNTVKTAIQTLNNNIQTKTGVNPDLFLSISTKGMPQVGPYITITSKGLQDTFGTSRPFGYMGIDLGTARYGIGKGSFGSNQVQLSPSAQDTQLLKTSIVNGITKTLGGGDKGANFARKYGEQILAECQTFFNTVDPIFKKLTSYKGLDFTKNDGTTYIIGQSQPLVVK